MKSILYMNFFLFILFIIFLIPSSLAFGIVEGEINFILKKGNKFFNIEKFEEAISIYDEVLEIVPNNVVALGKKADALAKLGNSEDALFYYEKVLGMHPFQRDAYGTPFFDKILEIDPNHTFALYSKSTDLFNNESLEEAIQYLDKILEREPNNALALGKKGEVIEMLGNSQEAMVYFEKALKIDPNHVVALGIKGDSFVNLGNSEEALIYYDKIMEISPYHRDSSGTPYFDKILEIDPNHAVALYYKGTTFTFFENLLETAISYFDKAIEIDPNYVDALSEKGDVLVRLGKTQQGISYFDQALELEPKNLDVLSKKGDALVKIGKFEEGQTYFDNVLEIEPNHLDTLYKKGDAFRDQNNIEDAFSYYYKVLETDSNHNLARNKIFIVGSKLGLENVDGFMETTIRDSQENLVAHLRIPKIAMLKHEMVTDMVKDWPVTKIVTRNGTDYEVHQFERNRIVGYSGGVWGGANHFGIHPPFGTNVWLFYANYWMFLPEKGDTINYVYTIFVPVE